MPTPPLPTWTRIPAMLKAIPCALASEQVICKLASKTNKANKRRFDANFAALYIVNLPPLKKKKVWVQCVTATSKTLEGLRACQ